ncbi:sensor histidine kinase YesM [Wenyingzhuangia heitensis]|uniref:Sensor histidine kinase YesM n=1 Tax=Wenyingzhuangia heitensis TaxID=1487859 RepID=A0ABX0U7E1_9FLAO|nr:histidine kinase [Wenyingzhuangia heitensis]NIJ44775.1 sensor histidine kinase YesM [Wenyingzhuangia heitensis]
MIKLINRKIIKQGICESYSDTHNKKIELLNTYALIWVYFVLVFPIADFIFGIFVLKTTLAHICTFLALGVVVVLNRFHQFIIARFFWLLTAFVNFTAFSLYILPGTYMEYYFIILSGISLSLYDKKTVPIICTGFSFIGFLTPYFFIKVYPKEYADRIEVPAVFGLFLAVYFLVSYFKKLNLANEKKLSLAYESLTESKKSEVAHLQLKSLKAQMNPHFMFNAMNSIQNLVLKGDRNEAYNYLTKFSLMIRENLNMSEKSFVLFKEELSLLKKYLELEKLRFKDSFKYKIIGANTIESIKIPAMIIQPFIENSIKHGLLHKVDGVKKLEVVFKLEKEVLVCVITDNGVGVKASKKINEENESKQDSFSTRAIQQRLIFLTDFYKTDIGFTYLPTSVGTKVEVKIPYVTEPS